MLRGAALLQGLSFSRSVCYKSLTLIVVNPLQSFSGLPDS
jgi:hypothetical protein